MINLRLQWKSRGIVTDNIVFRLHYQLTLCILLLLSIIIAVRQQFGRPISCIGRYDDLTFLSDYCYFHSTFSVSDSWEKSVGEEIPYPGISKHHTEETRVYHHYYKWVSFVLFFQAVLFLVPRCFWTSMESGRIREMVSDLKSSKEIPNMNLHSLANQVASDFNYNRGYFLQYFLAEVLNLVNVIGQIFLMDAFLGGEFLSYGSQILGYTSENGGKEYNPMIRVFPQLTKCLLHAYGSSGDVQRHPAMCHLPLNILNAKIYSFLWFWFIILAVMSCFAVVYRLMILISPRIRMSILMFRTRPEAKHSLQTILENRDAGDWFVIHLLSKNLKPSYFRDFVLILAGETGYVEPKVV